MIPSHEASPRPTLVLWNPRSGRSDQAVEALRYLRAQPETTVIESSSPEELVESTRTAAQEGYAHVIVAGGDGTLHAAVNALMASPERPSLAVLPTGTANDFAFTLGISDEPLIAAHQALRGTLRPVDVIECYGEGQQKFVVNVATGGNSDAVTRCLTPELKARWGALCYLRGSVEVLGNLEAFEAELTFDDDDQPMRVNLWNLLVANGRTNAGRLPIAPHASPEDGRMDVIVIRNGTAADLLELTTRFLVNNYLDAEQVIYRRAWRLRLNCHPPLPCSLDGEPWEVHPSEMICRQGALQMAVGVDYQGAQKSPADKDGARC